MMSKMSDSESENAVTVSANTVSNHHRNLESDTSENIATHTDLMTNKGCGLGSKFLSETFPGLAHKNQLDDVSENNGHTSRNEKCHSSSEHSVLLEKAETPTMPQGEIGSNVNNLERNSDVPQNDVELSCTTGQETNHINGSDNAVNVAQLNNINKMDASPMDMEDSADKRMDFEAASQNIDAASNSDNKEAVKTFPLTQSGEKDSFSTENKGSETGQHDSDGIVLVKIKQEPIKMMEYEKASYKNMRPIVVYSDSDDSDNNGGSDGSSLSDDDVLPSPRIELNSEGEVSDKEDNEDNEVISDAEEKQKKQRALQILLMKKRSRTEGELFPEELPPLEYLAINPVNGLQLQPLGVVSGIVGVLVIVKANLNTPALYDDTVLFSESSAPLGLVFEVFGTVEQPYYSVRFNNEEDIKERDIKIDDRIMFAPKADNLTKYVFIKELQSMKYDDASWENDNEPPLEHREFSDDEQEKQAKAKAKNSRRKGQLDRNENTAQRKQKRTRTFEHKAQVDATNGAPVLLKGDLNRNPFGDRTRSFNPAGKSQWPPQGPPRPHNAMQRPPRFFSTPPPSPGATFGEQPNWDQQRFRFQPPTFMNRCGGPPPRPDMMGGQMFRTPPPFPSFPPPRSGQFPPRQGPPTGQMNVTGLGNSPNATLPFNPSVPPPSFQSMFSSPPPSRPPQ